jgi:hypothetical protein
MKKKSPEKKVHKDLKGFDIGINPFGQLTSNRSMEDLNEFLNKHLIDRRVHSAEDAEEE